MPRIERPRTPLAWRLLGHGCVAALTGGFLWALWTHPLGVSALAALAVCGEVVSRHRANRHFARLLHARHGESICHFARSIDCRRVDTWVVRAVYEELQDHLSCQGVPLPVRAADRLRQDLRIDDDDLDLSLVPDMAGRAGRGLESTPSNPFFGQVVTVGDLVHFLNAQPRLQATAA
jgi:hypothetical protein